ncbi:MAG: hypothetical protein COW79_00030 [Bdellovibrionales bacterium CG22_combo_CG10-13_8_21_14_all_38_13]|nr:MAG: hypothetical protein COW79_00030 [Bdellovibrionales bacterium CG22_combo_CG10-13_8_21_14_all_38_13]
MIPLFSANGHELISMNGKKSCFYQIIPSDMEGMAEFSKESIFNDLEKNLVGTEGEFKLYWLNGKLYLNAFSDMDISHGQIVPCDKPLEVFWEAHAREIHFYDNYLTCGDQFIKVLALSDFPSTLNLLDTLKWPDFVIMARKLEKTQAKNKINLKRKLHYSSLFKGMRDVESENAYNEAENMLDRITTGECALFQVEIFIVIKGKTKKKLDQNAKEAIEYFKGVDSKLIQEEKGLSHFYQALIPGVPSSFKRSELCPSDYLSELIPFHQDYVHETGMKLNARSGNPLLWDIFHPSAINYNVLITGTTGQGKSMMTNKLLTSARNEGHKAVILDLGNSFYKTSRFHNGVVLSQKFNPLQFTNPRYLKEFVLSVIDEKLSKKDEGKLFEVISQISEKDISSFPDFLSHLDREFEGISYYFSEIKDYFTDDKSELNDLTYCDFSNYPDAMKAPLIIYLIEYFKNLKGKKLFIFDECWHLLSRNADYIAECFRTFRKHQASAIAISQNLDDFSITQLGRVIIQNTYWKALFRQSLSPTEFVDSDAIELLAGIKSKKGAYSEFLLLSESIKKPMRFYPSHLEYELFTSDGEDNRKIYSYLEANENYLSFNDCLINFTKIKHPYWEYRNER